MTTETTVNAALDMAVFQRQPPRGVILHSDRGVQYASKSFKEKLEKHGMIQSMSGKGNCYDNAVTETFFKTLKTEWIYCHRYRNQEDVRRSVLEYIEVFYNRKLTHSALGYLSPAEFYRNYHQSGSLAS